MGNWDGAIFRSIGWVLLLGVGYSFMKLVFQFLCIQYKISWHYLDGLLQFTLLYLLWVGLLSVSRFIGQYVSGQSQNTYTICCPARS